MSSSTGWIFFVLDEQGRALAAVSIADEYESEEAAAARATQAFSRAGYAKRGYRVDLAWTKSDAAPVCGSALPERWFRNAASVVAERSSFDDGDLDLDDEEKRVVSAGTDSGAFVSAWLWVDADDAIEQVSDEAVCAFDSPMVLNVVDERTHSRSNALRFG